MKKAVLMGLILLLFPAVGRSQTTLNFPAAIRPGLLNQFGYAVVNPTAAAATVTLKLYNHSDGAEIGSATMIVPAQGQAARLASELFATAPAISPASWIQASSSATGLQGFYIVGDFLIRVDGADAASSSTDLIFPLLGDTTALNIANPGTGSSVVTTRFLGADGADVTASTNRTIVGHGGFYAEYTSVSTVYPLAKYVRVTATAAVVGVSDISNFLVFGKDSAVTNGLPAASGTAELNFPHLINGQSGPANYVTSLAVTNVGSATQTVTITYTPPAGSPISVQRTIAANGSLRENAQTLFNFPAAFQNGWLQVSGTGPLLGVVAYAETTAGGLAIVPARGSGQTTVLFAHIADLNPWWTGIALLNTTNTDAQVEVFAMNANGTLIGGAGNVVAARFTLPARAKTSRLLSEIVSQTQLRGVDGGFVFIRSTNGVPILGIELFFLRSGAALANVSAGSLPAGVGYTPPTQ